jgi:uncharacterized protein YdiU (UPF0061 family)
VLTQALLPFLENEKDQALASGQAAIDAFPDLYQTAYEHDMRKKLGLTEKAAGDEELIRDLSQLMQDEHADFTLTFRRLSDLVNPLTASGGGVGCIFELPETFGPWLKRWFQRLTGDSLETGQRQAAMYAVNPVYIPRNHLVEEAISAAEKQQDYEPFNKLVDILAQPFDFDATHARYATPPQPGQVVTQTFCGT